MKYALGLWPRWSAPKFLRVYPSPLYIIQLVPKPTVIRNTAASEADNSDSAIGLYWEEGKAGSSGCEGIVW